MSKLKQGDINRDDILALFHKIGLIAFLHAQVAEKHPFYRIGYHLGCIRL